MNSVRTMPAEHKVALLVNFIPPYRVPLFEALQRRVGGLRVFISTRLEPNRTWAVAWGNLDVKVQRNITVRTRWRRQAGYSDVDFVHLPYDTLYQLVRFRPKVVISGEMGLRTALAALYRRLRPAVRLVVWATVSEHTERDRGWLRHIMRSRLLRNADAVLVNGASGARYIEQLGVPAHRIIRAPYTTDTSTYTGDTSMTTDGFQRGNHGNNCLRLLFVGLLVERKGLLPFLQTLRSWGERHPSKRVELRLAGDGPQRETLERIEMPSNIDVRFLGNVAYNELPGVYRDADVSVLPTLADEWGVVVNEAMSAGLPVLGSLYSQAVEELVTDNETGWTFYPNDPESIYDALDRALHVSTEKRLEMGIAARRRSLEVTPAHVAGRIAEAIGCAIERPS